MTCGGHWLSDFGYPLPLEKGKVEVRTRNQYFLLYADLNSRLLPNFSQKCPNGKIFNPNTLKCERGRCGTTTPTTTIATTTTTTTQRPIESCSSSTAADCSQRRDGFYAFSNCCQQFTVCLKGISYLGVFIFQLQAHFFIPSTNSWLNNYFNQNCGSGKLFNPLTGGCTSCNSGLSHNVAPIFIATTDTRAVCGSATAISCDGRKNGYYAYSSCCRYYTICVQGSTAIQAVRSSQFQSH